MYGEMIVVVFLSLCMLISGQYNDERDLPQARYQAMRSYNPTFAAQFPRGRCPNDFYQIGDECLYFPNDGRIYSWKNTERVCSKRVARILRQLPSMNPDQPNMNPTNGVRQVILNTPAKTDLFRGILRDYNEQNFAVRLPSDYHSLQRCRDGKDDKWPQLCANSQYRNSTCFETIKYGENDICLLGVECQKQDLRAACEFTLPGSPELTQSQFRQCLTAARSGKRLPKWAWIAIVIGGSLLILGIIGAIFGFIQRGKKNKANKKPMPEPRPQQPAVIRLTPKREDPAAQPMLTRTGTANVTDTGYLQPRSLPIDNTANA